MTAPRGITQPPTSFIGFQCQGIHHAPLNTYNTNKNKIAHQHHTITQSRKTRPPALLDARNHYPQIKHHTPPPRWSDNTHAPPPQQQMEAGTPRPTSETTRGPVASKPNSVSGDPPPHTPAHGPCAKKQVFDCLLCTRPRPTTGQRPSSNRLRIRCPRTMRAGPGHEVLLRKEVIQPHLPVRLPCYDFVPIADPTFDGSPPCGLGHRLRVLPTFMT